MLGGFHEVTITEKTKVAMEKKREAQAEKGRQRTQWRVSSTEFIMFRNDVNVDPLGELAHLYKKEDAEKYQCNFTAFDLLMQELSATGMVEKPD